MCRLVILKANEHPFPKVILDQLLIRSTAEGQLDGWGYTDDGRTVNRFLKPYSLMNGFSILDTIQYKSIVSLHVRSSSPKTGKTIQEVHPFKFKHFIGAHNGSVELSLKKNMSADKPNVDSFALFSTLSAFMRTENITSVNKEILTKLMSVVKETSEFTIWLDQIVNNRREVLVLVYNRPLYYLKMTSSTEVWSTSKFVLDGMLWATAGCPLEYRKIAPETLITIHEESYSEEHIDITDLLYPPKTDTMSDTYYD